MGKTVDHGKIRIGDLVTLEPKGCAPETGVVVDTRLYECDVHWFFGYPRNPCRENYEHLVKLS